MISFGPMSISLLLCAFQGSVLAGLLFRTQRNQAANRCLAFFIIAFVALITPYIIGYAGFYDKWPWLSFAPFSYTLAFGPLIYFYTVSLVDKPPVSQWPHFMPVLLQFLAYALVFPLPLQTKNWWDGFAHAPIVSPTLEFATLASIAAWDCGSSAVSCVSTMARRKPNRRRRFRSKLVTQIPDCSSYCKYDLARLHGGQHDQSNARLFRPVRALCHFFGACRLSRHCRLAAQRNAISADDSARDCSNRSRSQTAGIRTRLGGTGTGLVESDRRSRTLA